MNNIKEAIKQLITISENELNGFLEHATIETIKRNTIISQPYVIPNEIFFINKGTIRFLITDNEGNEHTIYFAIENQFIADYSNFIEKQPSIYSLQAVEETEVVILPRTSIEWGYQNLNEGQKLGRLIAEYYFIVTKVSDHLFEGFSSTILNKNDKFYERESRCHHVSRCG